MAPARSGIHHLELGSRDLERSRDFYQGLLGFHEVEVSEPRRDGESTCWFAAGPALVKVVLVGESGDPGSWLNEDLQGGLRHAGFKVGDIDAQMRRLDPGAVATLRGMQGASYRVSAIRTTVSACGWCVFLFGWGCPCGCPCGSPNLAAPISRSSAGCSAGGRSVGLHRDPPIRALKVLGFDRDRHRCARLGRRASGTGTGGRPP